MSVSLSKADLSSYNYHYINGLVTRCDIKGACFEKRLFTTGEWSRINDPVIIGEMMRGKNPISDSTKAAQIFVKLRQELNQVKMIETKLQ